MVRLLKLVSLLALLANHALSAPMADSAPALPIRDMSGLETHYGLAVDLEPRLAVKTPHQPRKAIGLHKVPMGHGPKMPSGTPRPVAQPDPDSVEAVEEETTDTTNTTNATDTTDTTDTNDTTGDSDTADDTDDTDDTDTTVDTATTDGTDDSDTTETTESDSDTDADADADADADTEESDSDDENDFLVDANTDGSFSVHHSAATVTVEAAAPTETGRNITQDRLRAKKAEPNAWFRPLNGDKVEKCTQGCKISVQISNDNVNVASIGMSGTGENQGFSGRAARFTDGPFFNISQMVESGIGYMCTSGDCVGAEGKNENGYGLFQNRTWTFEGCKGGDAACDLWTAKPLDIKMQVSLEGAPDQTLIDLMIKVAASMLDERNNITKHDVVHVEDSITPNPPSRKRSLNRLDQRAPLGPLMHDPDMPSPSELKQEAKNQAPPNPPMKNDLWTQSIPSFISVSLSTVLDPASVAVLMIETSVCDPNPPLDWDCEAWKKMSLVAESFFPIPALDILGVDINCTTRETKFKAC